MRRPLTLILVAGCMAAVAVLAVGPPGAALARGRTLSISSSPSTLPQAGTVTISGRLAGAPRGTVVRLYRRLSGWRHFHYSAKTRTGAGGRYQFVFALTKGRQWYVKADRIRSRVITERVGADVTLTSSQTAPAPGDQVMLSGQVTPAHPGERIELQQNAGAGWTTVQSTKLGSGSSY